MRRPATIIETVAPARLGRSFRWLLASAVVTNVGDGIALSAPDRTETRIGLVVRRRTGRRDVADGGR